VTPSLDPDAALAALLDKSQDENPRDSILRQVKVVAEYLKLSPAKCDSAKLKKLPDQAKILIAQQFFEHTELGSHKTNFDRDIVSRLLLEWFGIELDGPTSPPLAINALPGRPAHSSICRVKFGDTDIFLNSSEARKAAASSLIETIETEAFLTTDKTSPPCQLTEFVPLWLGDRDRPTTDYYLGDSREHLIDHYVQRQANAVLAELGVEIRERSTEMAIIANADALRFHRDRLVKQYAQLQRLDGPPDSYRLVQDLCLIDWDMQSATMSGTLFDHPNGDRYLFALYPGEIAGFFFSEPVRLPGPMMMPYHCALPVFDRFADVTVGPAKGKRLSTLVRGFAHAGELKTLAERANSLLINDLERRSADLRSYLNGVEVDANHRCPHTILMPIAILENDQGLSVAELNINENTQLLRAIIPETTRQVRLFRIEKHGAGFSTLGGVIPRFDHASQVLVVNRSRHGPHSGISYPVALDFTHRGQPWIQLLPMNDGAVASCPLPTRDLLRLSPPDEILHRSAMLDSFYPSTTTRNRLVNVVDIVVVG